MLHLCVQISFHYIWYTICLLCYKLRLNSISCCQGLLILPMFLQNWVSNDMLFIKTLPYNENINCRCETLTLSTFLRWGTHNGWVNCYCKLHFLFTFTHIAKEKLHNSVFTTYKKGKKIRARSFSQKAYWSIDQKKDRCTLLNL